MPYDIRPIRTEVDYENTLKRIDEIFDAAPGTPVGDELDILVVLVEAYEAQHYTFNWPPLRASIEFVMDQHDYTQADLANIIGRNRASELLSGARDTISAALFAKLSKAWGIPAEVYFSTAKLDVA